MAKYKFIVSVDITSFKGSNVATTETVTLSNYGNNNKGFKTLQVAKNFFKEIVESLSTSDNKENVLYNIKDNKNFSLGYYDKVNREFINREYKVVRI
jgi:hypothetical protein